MSEEKKGDGIKFLGREPMGEENISAEELEEMLEAVKKSLRLMGLSEQDIQAVLKFYASKMQESSGSSEDG